MLTRRSVHGFASLLIFGVCGCASVHVKRIDPLTHSPEVEGFRYYLPRPYVALRKPFAVAGGDYFITGQVDAKNRVVNILDNGIPGDVRRHLGWPEKGPISIDPASFVVSPANPYADQSSASGWNSQSASAETTETPPNPLDMESLLTSSVTPALLPADGQSFQVTVKLARGAPFTTITAVSVVLVPIDEAKAGASAVQSAKSISLKAQLPPTAAFVAGTTDGQYSATGLRAELIESRFYTVGLLVDGTYAPAGPAPKNGKHLAYGTTVKLSVLGEVGVKQGEDKSDKEGGDTSAGQTKASVSTSGDPATDPLEKINDYLDVLYLPDFDEQYAVNAKPGLGKAEMKMGFENGWMVETAQVQVDNTELGKFIYSSAQKFIDLGAKLAETSLFPPAAVMDAASPLATQSKEDGATVLLRVRYALEAQPGVYPVLKPSEARDQGEDDSRLPTQGSSEYVMIAYPPYTVVSYNVRRVVSIELVDATPAVAGGAAAAAPGGPVVPNEITPKTGIGKDITTAFETWLTTKGWDKGNSGIWKKATIELAKNELRLTLKPEGNVPDEKAVRDELLKGKTVWTIPQTDGKRWDLTVKPIAP